MTSEAGGCRRLVGCCGNLLRMKSARVSAEEEEEDVVKLHNVLDLTNVGVSSTLAMAVYVISGQVTSDIAGPSVLLSVIIAFISATLSAMCYAELRCRWPRFQGSAYDYTYFSAGEGAAILVGWFSLLQQMASICALSRAVASNLDAMLGFQLYNLTVTHIGELTCLGSYPALPAGLVALLAAIFVSLGLSLPKHCHLVVNIITILVTLFVLVVGLFRIDFSLWSQPTDFFQNGLNGVMEGASTMFFIFTFFEMISNKCNYIGHSGRSTILSLALTTILVLFYATSVAAIISLLNPMTDVASEAPYPQSYVLVGFTWIRFIIGIGALVALPCALCEVSTNTATLMQRMARDGLLFECLQWTNGDDRRSPVPAVVIGFISVIFSVILSLTNLIQLACFSSFVIYSVSCLSVLSLRYSTPVSLARASARQQKRRQRRKREVNSNSVHSYGSTSGDSALLSPIANVNTAAYDTDDTLLDLSGGATFSNGQIQTEDDSSDTDIDEMVEEYRDKLRRSAQTTCGVSREYLNIPSAASHKRAVLALTAFVACMVCVSAILRHAPGSLRSGSILVILLLCFLLLFALVAAVVLIKQPIDIEDMNDIAITIPALPWIPLITLVVDVHLLMQAPALVWVEVGVWSLLGVVMYLSYGIRNSRAGMRYNLFSGEHEGLLSSASPEHHRNQLDPQQQQQHTATYRRALDDSLLE